MVEDQPSTAPAGAAVPRDAPTIGGGRYALVSKIAEGGMAGVYRAWDFKLRVWRAIKILVPEFAQRDVLRHRFEAEAKTMARLDNPHVVSVYDVGTREPLPYMVMELAEGGTVNTWIDTHGKMPPRLAVHVVEQVARGLGAAHTLGVVHRDVKPHNVLVTADGQCKVTDFGIARVLDQGDDGQTRTGATMGTIGYMAPEQRADAKLVDQRADIYALGALLYKLVTGKVMTDLFLVEHEPALLRNVPEALHEIIVRACYHDRERRYPGTEALMRALYEVVDLLPEDPPDTPPLPIPLAEPLRDYSNGFPEIAVLLSGQGASGGAGGASARPTRSSSATPVPLPYTMSRPAPRSRSPGGVEALPSYVDPAAPPSLPPPGRSPSVPPHSRSPSLPPHSRSPSLPPHSRSPSLPPHAKSPPSLPPDARVRPARPSEPPLSEVDEDAGDDASIHPVTVEQRRQSSLSAPWIGGLALASVFLWSLVFVIAAFGMYDARQRADASDQARRRMYATIEQERTLLPELLSRGVPHRDVLVLSSLYDVYAAAQEEPERTLAAVNYISAVSGESRELLRGPSDLARVRAGNLERSWKAYESAHHQWLEASHTPHGWLAIRTGLARVDY